jgi:hypothetical protein
MDSADAVGIPLSQLRQLPLDLLAEDNRRTIRNERDERMLLSEQ